MAPQTQVSLQPPKRPLDPFRRAVLRGLAVLLPPLLTIVIFVWVYNTVITYMLEPMERNARAALMTYATDIQPDRADAEQNEDDPNQYTIEDKQYVRTKDDRFIPLDVYKKVKPSVGRSTSRDADVIYEEYIDQEYLKRWFVIPVFLGVLILVLYLLGRFLAAGVGRFLWGQLERVITRLPLISKVYSSVKQVTDFMFSDTTIKATRVVAIEYPRRGIWTLAMVTGESMLDIRAAANEPVLSVLVPTSPMPFTGFTMTVRKSETIDLNITIDQAIQFIVSCGVVVPPGQVATDVDERDRLILPDTAHPPSGPNMTPKSE
ncbi:DUF502 domain-containing protein [Aeoliella sp. ICT_H6.2]|uniref:DUF502 domain-containing protein n=1 Tax=Aeoliella straminimaris TaxID=2954799 RepID=A0A9X2JEL6_9BACT|nr:DUF502 domain-containing protein [Aeoliella straminimaris]MCO6042312.1 DUF502 domain-containing protein [Aeoliella straminimaris]